MTAPAHDPERERIDRELEEATREWQRAFDSHPRPENVYNLWRVMTAKRKQALEYDFRHPESHDQARGPTVPTRTASGYRNQAAPDE